MNLYFGIVENNDDPLKISRCQVRIFGKHTENKSVYPTTDLPWAIVLSNGPNISEMSNFQLPNNGDFVVVSFVDPEEQNPIILGSLPKIVKQLPDFTKGFSDPNQINPDPNKLNESSISRLARNENISDTIIQDKKDNRTTGVQCVGTSWDEPETQYNTEYPYNRVIQTKHHIIELDDTSGAERVHIYHKTGTSKEIHPNGDEVNLVKAKKFLIVESDNNVLVKGNCNVHIDGNENTQVGGNVNISASGEVNITASGDVNVIGDTINLN